jgi:hypothetical protein
LRQKPLGQYVLRAPHDERRPSVLIRFTQGMIPTTAGFVGVFTA